MKVLSVNTGQPKEYTLDGMTMKTSMVRTPQNSIHVKFKQVEGDVFLSPQIHGTPESVVYSLSADRFSEWTKFLGFEVKAGQFGENITLDHQREDDVMCGDEFQVGSCILRATGPRYPCNRLNFSTGNKNMQREFEKRAWPGIYYEVVQEGFVKAGDELKRMKRVQSDVSILDIFLALRESRTGGPVTDKIHQIVNNPFVKPLFSDRIKKSFGL